MLTRVARVFVACCSFQRFISFAAGAAVAELKLHMAAQGGEGGAYVRVCVCARARLKDQREREKERGELG